LVGGVADCGAPRLSGVLSSSAAILSASNFCFSASLRFASASFFFRLLLLFLGLALLLELLLELLLLVRRRARLRRRLGWRGRELIGDRVFLRLGRRLGLLRLGRRRRLGCGGRRRDRLRLLRLLLGGLLRRLFLRFRFELL
jgi:hypothetical protein